MEECYAGLETEKSKGSNYFQYITRQTNLCQQTWYIVKENCHTPFSFLIRNL